MVEGIYINEQIKNIIKDNLYSEEGKDEKIAISLWDFGTLSVYCMPAVYITII